MIRRACLALIILVFSGSVLAQPAKPPAPSASKPQTPLAQTQTAVPFELSEYGVSLQPDARLIIVMAALEAAGFDPTPPGKGPAAFRMLVRRDQANLDAGLRKRLKGFFDPKKLPEPATPAEQ